MFEAQVAYVGDFTHLSGDVIPLAKAKESILPAMLYQHVRVLLADLLSKAQFPSRMPYVLPLADFSEPTEARD
jgi:preprotein translocase subunit SecB